MKAFSSGEFGLIEWIRQRFGDIPTGTRSGIGDDCAILPVDDLRSWVVTADMLVEQVHFLRPHITPYDLGYKSLAVNLSDVAAMGATPIASFLSIALPNDLPEGWIEAFMEGYHALSARYGVPLLGGDTTSSQQGISINVTALGEVCNHEIKRRSDAKEGDIILVSGELGNSAQGLLDIQAGDDNSPFLEAHCRPEPAVKEGIWLGQQNDIHAMMDLSDGLASDLLHILKASNAGAEVIVEHIPTRTSVELAVTGGEDYQLLCTASAAGVPVLQKNYENLFGKPLYAIGRIVAGPAAIIWRQNGEIIHPGWKGFSHF